MTAPSPLIAVRASSGVSICQGVPSYEVDQTFSKDESKTCRCIKFSPHGEYLAWANGSKVNLVKTNGWEVVASLDKPKAQDIHFSPKGTYFAVWELYSKAGDSNEEVLNMCIYRTSTGELLKAYEQKKQENWQPQWTGDELYCSRNWKNDVLFYNSEGLGNPPEFKLANQRVHNYGLSPTGPPYYLLCYIPGKSGQPSNGKLYQHGNFENPIASKSFFQADRVEIFWNKKSTGILFMTTVDVDKSGSSYYGKQGLYFMTTKGYTAMVQLNKEGPIHAIEWSPQSHEFCVIYGFMPAKATVFNLRVEPVFELGTGHRNSIYYNPQGNILLLGGFGNLQGTVELWEAPARKLINKAKAADTTLVSWSPDGIHFMTATTAPRLRVGNGYKIWHHSGTLLHEKLWPKQEELWEVIWQNVPPGTFKTPQVSYQQVEGGIPTQAPAAATQAYRPPTARGRPSTFKLNAEVVDIAPGSVVGSKGPGQMSKNALKAKKNREAKKAAKAEQQPNSQENGTVERTETSNTLKEFSSNNPENMKKISKLRTKLNEIEKLKEQQKAGKQLEKNQLEKIKTESQLLEKMRELSM